MIRLSKERILNINIGEMLKIGKDIIVFNGIKNNNGMTEVSFINSEGIKSQYGLNLFISIATENMDTQQCYYCGKYRIKKDLKMVLIHRYRKRVMHSFCSDNNCAFRYQSTIKLPANKIRK
ncbi:hypothetical protein CBW53_02925 [Yersinia frederiksenii]|nr:hypothetical protein CBW53_02925 [Yersinia frederiksenii]